MPSNSHIFNKLQYCFVYIKQNIAFDKRKNGGDKKWVKLTFLRAVGKKMGSENVRLRDNIPENQNILPRSYTVPPVGGITEWYKAVRLRFNSVKLSG